MLIAFSFVLQHKVLGSFVWFSSLLLLGKKLKIFLNQRAYLYLLVIDGNIEVGRCLVAFL